MILLFASLMPIVILFCGLSLDVGLLELKKLQLQTAADAAALGAELEAERGTNNWITEGTLDAGINGFTNGVNNVTVTVTTMPTSGAYSGRYDSLQATVTQTVSTLFLGALNGGAITLSAQAVALVTPCVYLLGTGSLQAYPLTIYSGSLNAQSCSIDTNLKMSVATDGSDTTLATNVTGGAGASNLSGYIYPYPLFGAIAMTDPLAAMTQPTFSGTCNHTSYSLSSGTATLSPGTYCKGLNLTSSTVTLNPGLYVITGGATWSASTVTGTGVTLFFTTGGGATTYGQFAIKNNSSVTLSAPTDSSNGGTPAVVVFADRNWTNTSAQDFQINTASFSGDGIWYIPNAGMYIWSATYVSGTNYMGLVADNLYLGGTIYTPLNNYSYVTIGNPFRTLGALVQ